MRTKKDVDKSIDEAEKEIKATLEKHGVYLTMMYKEGVCLMIGNQETHPNGDIRVTERETDI